MNLKKLSMLFKLKQCVKSWSKAELINVSNKKLFVIDGEFLCQSGMNGMHRFMYEILKRVDRLVEGKPIEIQIIIKNNEKINNLTFKNIKVVSLKSNKYIYRLFTIPMYMKKNGGIYCSLSNGYIGCKNSVATICDLNPLYKECKYSIKSKFHMQLIYSSIKRNATKVITISQNSKNDICRLLNIDDNKIELVECGWEHIIDISNNVNIVERFQIKRNYYYALGSPYEYKNTKWVCENAKNNLDDYYVIGGKVSKPLLNEYKSVKNIKFVGEISDEDHKALLAGCDAFLFPSKLEGFGIPPMEALALGKKIVISNVSCMPEIYKNSAYYVDPNDYSVKIKGLLGEKVTDGKEVLDEYNWDRAAIKLCEIIANTC